MEKIKYILKIRSSILDSTPIIRQTTLRDIFIGTKVNDNNGNFYFEDSENPAALVIIPHNWIEWMAPLNEATTK